VSEAARHSPDIPRDIRINRPRTAIYTDEDARRGGRRSSPRSRRPLRNQLPNRRPTSRYGYGNEGAAFSTTRDSVVLRDHHGRHRTRGSRSSKVG
jgi:hypothetical protein